MKRFTITPAPTWSRSTKLALCSAMLLSLANCTKKEDFVSPSIGGISSRQDMQTPPLDWEHISFVPGNSNTPVQVPWGGGNSNSISNAILFDYKSVDGWTLVANTFTANTTPDNQYFVLYNKYRGIFRMYYYRPANATTIYSTNLINTLSTAGAGSSYRNSPILNFANQDIVDPQTNAGFATTTQPIMTTSATWYAFEYELAYDRNLSTQNYQNFFFRWPISALQVTQLSVNGKIQGDITGKMSLPDVNLSVTGGTQNINSRGGTQVINGADEADKLLASLGKAAVDGIKQGITNGISGVISGFLGGIFGSDSGQPVSLKVNEDISLTGTLTSTAGLGSLSLNVPGVDQTGSVGYDPAYTKTPGVFYMVKRLTYTQTKYVAGDGIHVPTNTFFVAPDITSNEASSCLVFNPEVLAIADIENMHEEIIAAPNGGTNASGITEIIGTNSQGPITYLTGTGLQADNIAPAVVGIRFSFDVVPKNPAAKRVRIVKTFAATMSSEQVINLPPGEDPY